MDELSRLRERVRELEAQNLALLRENAQLRTAQAAVAPRALGMMRPAGRRLDVLATTVAAAEAELALEDDVSFLPFLEGREYGLDSVGTELYLKAKTLMPQGCGLISKRPETFLPDRWPSYYERAEGAFVWDLSGNKYLDMCNSPGPYALGAADPDVNAAVVKAIEAGSFSTLNPPEEVELAEVLIDLHPWCKGGMARFARGGGEIDMLAARIARAATNRDRIAICGYHGWTDWYIGANFDDNSAGGQTLAADPRYVTQGTGHGTLGVPTQIAGSAVAWDFDRLDELRAIFDAYPGEIAAVMMEVCRSTDPPPGHLEAVRDLCTANGALLIFDEVSSAWRETLGGRHLMYNVSPDMCTFSKTISNGFAMAAVIGTREAMADAASSFISTTYHTERVGPAAALATIEKMKRCNVQAHNCAMGRLIRQGWQEAAGETGLAISISGFDPWPSFKFGEAPSEYSAAPAAGPQSPLPTLFTQEMLKKGFLANGTAIPTYAHKPHHVAVYLQAVREVFADIAGWLEEVGGDEDRLSAKLLGPMAGAPAIRQRLVR